MGKVESKKAQKADANKAKASKAARGKNASGQLGAKTKMPPVFSCQEFLEAFENGTLQKRLANYLEGHGMSVSDSVLRSWNNSYAYLDIALRGADMPTDFKVVCECPADAASPGTSGRVDVVLLWPRVKGKGPRHAVVMEFKQWDQYFLARNCATEKNEPKNPFDQVHSYANALETNGCCGEQVRAFPCVFLHNMPIEECGRFEVLKNRHDDVAEFYQGEIARLRSFLRNVQRQAPANALSPLRAIERARKYGYWHDALPSDAKGFRDALVGKGYARILLSDRYDFEPTTKGEKLGIIRFEGYDAKKRRCFVICKFTDKAMRRLAKKLGKD